VSEAAAAQQDAPRTGAEDVAWDLTDVYAGPDDPTFEAELEDARASAAAFRDRYRGRLAGLDAGALLEAVEELERIEGLLVRAKSYAYLHFSTDMADPPRGALLQRISELEASLETELLFVRLEWNALADEHVAGLLGDERLRRYHHFLEALRRYRPHQLSEPEERVLTEKSVSGPAAWKRLFGELLSVLRVRLDGREASLEEGLSRLYAPEREVRRAAAEAITEGLDDGIRTRAFVFNAVLLDKAVDDRLRDYPHWLAARNLANEAPDETVDALVDAVVSRYDIPQRYYCLKAQLLGLDRLAHYDRMAPAGQTSAFLAWEDAVELVQGAYDSFSPQAGRIVSDFFARGWIDAPVRPDKMIGAYCMTRLPGAHPYVLMNYTGDRRSVLTLAHELGHGLHGVLAAEQGVFGSETPLTLAETASVFGEALVFRTLLEHETDDTRKLDLLIGRLDDAVGTVFRQIAMNRYEDRLHTTRRAEGELSVDRFGELWLETQAAMVGDAVDLDGYATWWSYIPHYVVSPGYVYAYAYGYLFSLAIFRRWEVEGDPIVEPYLELLRAGGSDSPVRLAAKVGLDLGDRALWETGLEAVDELLAEAEQLAGAVRAG
jgi:oligoendopeptidase F